jgi:hypothetical protein
MVATKAATKAEDARLPDEVAVRVVAYAKTPGIKTRSEAVRSLVLLRAEQHYEAERQTHRAAAPQKARALRRLVDWDPLESSCGLRDRWPVPSVGVGKAALSGTGFLDRGPKPGFNL